MRRLGAYVYFLSFFALLMGEVQAQYYFNGGESDFKPRYLLQKDNFRIIFPRWGDSAATRVADILEYNTPTVHITSRKYKGFPIVLHHNTPYSNGLVAWTPARMELYSLSGGESSEPTPWLTHLVSHELRHYAQMNALNWKAVRIAGYVIGEQAVALASAVTPMWFFEGDAVYYESANGRIGRLHSATQYQHYRAELLSGAHLSYDQHLNGSYYRFAPNHYHFGSLMVEYGYAKYGAEFWPEILNYTSLHLYQIFPFHFAIKRYTGLTRPQLFSRALGHLDSTTRSNTAQYPSQKIGAYQSELFPHYSPTLQQFFYLQRSYSEWQALFRTKNLEESKRERFVPIRSISGNIRYDDTIAIWVQLKSDPRWSNKQAADVWACNLATGRTRKLTQDVNAISPLPNLQRGVVQSIEVQPRGEFILTERRLTDGLLQHQEAKAFKGWELRELCAGATETSIVLRAVRDEGAYLLHYDWESQQVDTILGPLQKDISNINSDAAGLYFSMSQDYVRQAYFLPWQSKADSVTVLHPLSLDPYGVEYVCPIDTMLLYASYTLNGYKVHTVHRRVGVPVQLENLKPQLLFSQPERYRRQTNLKHTPTTLYSSRSYSQLGNALHFHSWAPFYFNPKGDIETLTHSKLGLTAMSQNATNTLAITAGYFYDKGHGGSLSLEWLGAWPRLWFSAYTDRRTFAYNLPALRVQRREQYYASELGLTFPYSWGERMYNYSVSATLVGSINNGYVYDTNRETLWQGLPAIRTSLYFSAMQLSARQCLFPRLGVSVNLVGRTYLLPQVELTKVFEAKVVGYFPGIGQTHGVRFSLYTLQQGLGTIEQAFSFTKRSLWFDASELLYRGKATLQADLDYAMPLAYPDFNLGSVLYLKRVYTVLFASYRQRQTVGNITSRTRVVGLELFNDFHFLRTQYPLRFGIVASYSPFGDALGPQSRRFWSLQGSFSVGIGEKHERPELRF